MVGDHSQKRCRNKPTRMLAEHQTTQIVTTVIVCLLSLGIGYKLGQIAKSSTTSSRKHKPSQSSDDVRLVEKEKIIPDGNLAAVKAGMFEACKMVLIVRTDLKLSSGQISSHCGQATLACYKALSNVNSKLTSHWELTGQAKIALKAKSEKQMQELEALAKSLDLCARSVTDPEAEKIGQTVTTVLGIGPAPVELVNKVTGKLRLL